MGLILPWKEGFIAALQHMDGQIIQLNTRPYCLVECNGQLVVHLVALENNFEPMALLALQEKYAKENKFLVQLWEDVWLTKRTQVLARIKSFLGLNKGCHARKAMIEQLTKQQVAAFLEAYHLQGYVKAAYNYGLTIENELVAVASFSKPRPMQTKGINYKSAELVRFSSKDGLTVVGGLSKLIKYYTKQVQINDLMTYADRDWSLGKGYLKLGFTQSQTTPPTSLYLQLDTLRRYFSHRLPKEFRSALEDRNAFNADDFLLSKGFKKLFNTGNLKYHLYL